MTILAKKSSDSFARIAVLCSKHRSRGILRILSVFPVVLEAEVLAVAVVEVAGL